MKEWIIKIVSIKCPICGISREFNGDDMSTINLVGKLGCKVTCSCGFEGELPIK